MHKHDKVTKKVIVIGLDGATWKILDPWIRENKLPWFRKMRKERFSSTLHSTLPPLTGSAWASFQTGVNPGKHGILDFVHYKKTGLNELVSSDDIPYPPIWEWLEKGGKKSIVVNMPLTYPIKKGKSTIISSLMTPPGKQYAWPSSIYKKLQEMNYQVDLLDMSFGSPEESMKNRKRYFKKTLMMAKKRMEAGNMLLKNNWDFFFILFKSTDITQHLFFNGEETLKLYQEIEKYLQELITVAQKKYDANLVTIICSDHGFHEGETMSFSLYRWLEKEGYLRKKDPRSYQLLRKGYQIIKRFSPGTAESGKIEHTRSKLYEKETQKRLSLIRTKEPAWPVPFGIYLNDKTLIREIKLKLEQLKYKNKKVFKKVYKKKQVYKGERIDDVPDIIFLPSNWVLVEANESQEKVWKKKIGYLAGNHYSDPEGIILINPGKIFSIKKKKQYNILDLFPTIASALGQPIPAYCDGESILQRRTDEKNDLRVAKRKVEDMIDKEIKKL